MYKNKCKYCKKEIIVETGRHFSSHVANCYLNPNLELRAKKISNAALKRSDKKYYKIKCKKCDKIFELYLTSYLYNISRYRKHCSRYCANSKPCSDKKKEKIGRGVEKQHIIKEFTCQQCGIIFKKRLQNYQIIKNYCSKYCSRLCSSKGNRSHGPLKKETKRKIREWAIKYIKETCGGIRPNIGKNEKQILDKLEQDIGYKIIRQYNICGYFLDGYIKELNIAIEVDEEFHNKRKQKDEEREDNVKNELKCEFLRIKD